MSNRDKVSDEQLSAFVDNQLDRGEKDQLFAAAQQDPELLARACDYRQLKEMMRHAYHDGDGVTEPAPTHRRRINLQALAATLLLGLGGLVGWAAHTEWFNQAGHGSGRILQLGGAGDPLTGAVGVLLHLSTDDPVRMAGALDRVEGLLADYEKAGAATRVELLVNGSGLDLLRSDATPHARRLHDLNRRYANLTLLACNKALERFQLEHGVKAQLIGEAAIAPSALQQIVSRLQQGWTYIQI